MTLPRNLAGISSIGLGPLAAGLATLAVLMFAFGPGYPGSAGAAGEAARTAEPGAMTAEDVASPVIYTCSMHPQVLQDKPGNCPICGMKLVPLRQEAAGTPGGQGGTAVITIDPAVTQNMGIRVARAVSAPLSTTLRTVGYLRAPEPGVHEITARVSGFVERLHADTEGMLVKRGDPLLELYSPELVVAEEEALAAARALDRLPPGSDPAARESARVLAESARSKLSLWNVAEEDIDALIAAGRAGRTTTLRSPVTGFVVEKQVVQGSAIAAGQTLFRIEDHSTMWLDASIYDNQMPLVRIGQAASATVQGLPGRTFEGVIIFVSPQIDPETRTLVARLAFPNDPLILRPGMYGTVDIAIKAAEAVQIPREAVIDTGARQLVFVALEAGRFEPRDVQTGLETTGGMVEILKGIDPGETVVTSGQFLLDTESRTREAIQKMAQPAAGGHQHGGAAAPTAPATAPGKSDTGLVVATDALLLVYLPMAEALAADSKLEHAGLETLVEAAGTLAGEAGQGPLEPIAAGILEAARAMPHEPIAAQRAQFRVLSGHVVNLVEHVEPSAAVGDTLYIVHCSMYPGDWLQTTSHVANPFYGKSMLECGTIRRKLALARS